ncbi:MAG: hypothetical protein H0W65_02880 [Sphingomonas sp.]|uniref:hypothetical protein n=1 Tax=Sphingomonas sp. TaxID=28214 RepID=UPI0018075A7B|nr:hypothetical protein [Sphingomonas sp.]MBA3666653.1 hypothetical protein [Sphingomonas sp.]
MATSVNRVSRSAPMMTMRELRMADAASIWVISGPSTSYSQAAGIGLSRRFAIMANARNPSFPD